MTKPLEDRVSTLERIRDIDGMRIAELEQEVETMQETHEIQMRDATAMLFICATGFFVSFTMSLLMLVGLA